MQNKHKWSYVFCGSKEAKVYYQESPEALIASDCLDYMVFKISLYNKNVRAEYKKEWDVVFLIKEPTYNILHRNLCKKFGEIVGYKKDR